jgi:enolase
MLFKNIVGILALLSLGACATSAPKPTNDSSWFLTEHGNRFDVISSGNEDGYVANIELLQKTWESGLKGGEEKVSDRKKIMKKLADDEAKRICNTDYSITDDNFLMLDNDPNTYNTGGVLGVLVGYTIAAAASDYANLPTKYTLVFKCKNSIAKAKVDLTSPTDNQVKSNTNTVKNVTPLIEVKK